MAVSTVEQKTVLPDYQRDFLEKLLKIPMIQHSINNYSFVQCYILDIALVVTLVLDNS